MQTHTCTHSHTHTHTHTLTHSHTHTHKHFHRPIFSSRNSIIVSANLRSVHAGEKDSARLREHPFSLRTLGENPALCVLNCHVLQHHPKGHHMFPKVHSLPSSIYHVPFDHSSTKPQLPPIAEIKQLIYFRCGLTKHLGVLD